MPDQHDALDHADVVRRHGDVVVVEAAAAAQVEGVLVRRRGDERHALADADDALRASTEALANGSWLPSA